MQSHHARMAVRAARSSHRKGFTVVELIVAMTILMILTAVAVPIVTGDDPAQQGA